MRLKRSHRLPGIDALSTANIVFLVMLFFIVLCSTNADTGIERRLPPAIDADNKPEKIAPRNLLCIYITSNDELYCNGRLTAFGDLRAFVKRFVDNPSNNPGLPEKSKVVLPEFGVHYITDKHVISVQCERNTKYQAYIDVQNELNAAYNDLRNELALRTWSKNFDNLTESQQLAVCQYYPIHISEAEPFLKGGRQ